jgi:hypothetical protein
VNISEFEAKLQDAADIFVAKSREATLEWAETVEILCELAKAAEVPDHLALASIQMVASKIEQAIEELQKEL